MTFAPQVCVSQGRPMLSFAAHVILVLRKDIWRVRALLPSIQYGGLSLEALKLEGHSWWHWASDPVLAQEEWRGEVVEVSWSPRAFLLKSFLSDKECQHFIDKVCTKLVRLNW